MIRVLVAHDDRVRPLMEQAVSPALARSASAPAEGMSAGPLKELVGGVADGATAAPGWSYRHGLRASRVGRAHAK